MLRGFFRKALGVSLFLGIGFFAQSVFFAKEEPEPLLREVRENRAAIPEIGKIENPLATALARPDHPPEAAKAQVSDRFTKPPKDSVVDFKLIDGFAVAFGDTVIGKPVSGFTGDAGLVEMRPTRLWPSREIPYAIDESIKNKIPIQQAMELLQSRTEVRFVPFAGQEDAIVFTLGKENCMSSLGRIGGLQPIYLEPACGKLEIAHELMHALGFVHEQSRTDRDQYVSILWENIQTPFQSQFEMIPEAFMDVYGDTPFDPTSILMYNPHIFATHPNLETMKLKGSGAIQNAPNGLSEIDILRVNRLYRE